MLIMKHRYYTPIRPTKHGRQCLLIVKYPISCQHLSLLQKWVVSDERRSYSLLFLGERSNQTSEELAALFAWGVEFDHIWDENEVRLGLLLRYRLASFSYVMIDNSCSDLLCEIIFSGFNLKTGTGYKFLNDEIVFGNWDDRAGMVFSPGRTSGSLQKLDDGWYRSLNDAMKRARIWIHWYERKSLFPDWIDAWADSYSDFLREEGNVLSEVMSSLAHVVSQGPTNEVQWSTQEEMIRILTVFISRLKRFAESNGYDLYWSEDYIVTKVFSRREITTNQDRCEYFQGHVVCVIRFMQWLIQELVLGHNVYGLIENLVVDLHTLNKVVLNNVISDLYVGHHYSQRCGCPLTRWDHYRDAYRVAIYQRSPIWRTTAEIMGIAGLRQALESGFRRIIGLLETDAHMHHDLIPSALQHCHEIKYPNTDNNMPIDKIMHIYAWTNTAVHKALSDAVWLIWESFKYCSILFKPNTNSDTYDIDSAVQMPLKSLYEVRRRVAEGLCEWARKANVNSVQIQWGKPEVVILDQDVHQRNWNVYEHCGMAIEKSYEEQPPLECDPESEPRRLDPIGGVDEPRGVGAVE